jgi:hypothetical protein
MPARSSQPPPRRAKQRWLTRKTIAGGVLALMLISCAGMCFACTGLTWYFSSAVRNATDRVLHEALADGDRDELYQHTDEDFRKAYTEAELRTFVKDRPSILDRSRLEGVELRRKRLDDKAYLVLIARVADEGMVAFYCTVEDKGKLALLGISTGNRGAALDMAVPEAIRRLGVI